MSILQKYRNPRLKSLLERLMQETHAAAAQAAQQPVRRSNPKSNTGAAQSCLDQIKAGDYSCAGVPNLVKALASETPGLTPSEPPESPRPTNQSETPGLTPSEPPRPTNQSGVLSADYLRGLNPDLFVAIEAEADAAGLSPEERRGLHTIAFIESSYGRRNRGQVIGTEVSGDSRHHGQRAMGPFQFMPTTAQQYGLEDPMDYSQSARAAINHYRDALRHQGDMVKAFIGHHSGPAWTTLGPHGRQYKDRFTRYYNSWA